MKFFIYILTIINLTLAFLLLNQYKKSKELSDKLNFKIHLLENKNESISRLIFLLKKEKIDFSYIYSKLRETNSEFEIEADPIKDCKTIKFQETKLSFDDSCWLNKIYLCDTLIFPNSGD